MRLNSPLAFLTAVVVAGCSSSRDAPPTIVADTAPPTPSASSSALPKDVSAPTLVITPAGVRFADSPDLVAALDPDPSAGFEAASKKQGKNGLFVLPLGKALEDARAQKRIADTIGVTIDPKTPFRAAMEVFYTAGQNEIASFQVTEGRPEKPRSFSFKPPQIPTSRPVSVDPDAKALNLVLLLVNDGVSVKTAGGNIAPGCKEVGPGLAFTKSSGALDLAAIRACVEHLVEAIPTQEKGFTMTANPSIPFGGIFDIIEVVRTRADGSPLLPDVSFGIHR